jgi:5-formyltetrahydrofolate cyclo-ligase
MVVPPTALNALRRKLRDIRQSIPLKQKTNSLRLNSVLANLLAKAPSVGLYHPMGGEPDPWPLLERYDAVTALPALTPDEPLMIFRRWALGDVLVATAWGGQQPIKAAATVIPKFILVPMLGFDAAFNRIGQGGGHYDRYLAAHPAACRIGIAWEAQRVDRIEPQPWDVPMDAILTETGFYMKDLTRCQRP